ncbi:MAG: UbiX family flavin prenyltransferase [Rikenellaceae bacterium]|nr:UbiX family flavin prenyltransferase [Rikenellaceae bacterium]MCL2691828.1 UbiX family flavin prenyltransferase [Rikenellaceae bacterium]
MTPHPTRIVVGVTGASGAVYARLLVQELLRQPAITEIALIHSANGVAVAEYEGQLIVTDDPRIRRFDNADMFAAPASGSAGYEAMIVVPCSMGTAGRIACGVSDSLLTRAADVMLKERRPLLLVPRETPLSGIHLRNLATLSSAGAIVIPASPSFYSLPATLDALCMTVVERIVALLGFDAPHYEWNSRA